MAAPTQNELNNLSLACQKLWTLDSARLKPGRDYDIDVQPGKSVGAPGDVASRPLFSRVESSVFERPTFKLFQSLLDNYVSKTGVSDSLSAEEKEEVDRFLDAILQTPPMKYAHSYCAAKNVADKDVRSFRRQLYDMWFDEYNRDGQADSSGFEHVFVGEHDIDKGEVSGLHNWIRFYMEEQAGNIDYKGYIFPRKRGGPSVDALDQMLTVQFEWKGQMKKLSSMFIGTSPEFEFALFTMCFLAGSQSNEVEIDKYDVLIKCYRMRSRNGDKVGTAYPELLAEDPSNVGAAQEQVGGGGGRQQPNPPHNQGGNTSGGQGGRRNDNDNRRPGQGGQGGNAWGGQGGNGGGGQGGQGGNAWGGQGGQGGRRNDGDDDGRRAGQGYGQGNQGGNAWGGQGGGRQQGQGNEQGGRRHDDGQWPLPGQGGGQGNQGYGQGNQGYGQGGRRHDEEDGERRRPGQGYGQGAHRSDGASAWGR